jgi:hypothetical protein
MNINIGLLFMVLVRHLIRFGCDIIIKDLDVLRENFFIIRLIGKSFIIGVIWKMLI